jgi:D-sedoheptulose 7-phosphate isomerase
VGEPAAQVVAKGLTEHRDLASRLAQPALVASVEDAADLLVCRMLAGARLLVFGNGGSAADADHIAGEFVGRFRDDRRALPALSLSGGLSSLTAIANDYGYEHVFARQVEALASAGDVALGLSTSGRSANVLNALRRAQELGVVTIGLCGADDAAMRPVTDRCLAAPSRCVARVQETHLLWGHLLAEAVDEAVRR